MKIHILVGSKGGIGKTRCSISICKFYIKNNATPYLLDLNIMNQDLFDIFSGENENLQSNDFIIEKSNFLDNDIKKNYFNIKRINPYRLFNGTFEIWEIIHKIYEFAIQKNTNNNVLIIDTNLSLINIIPDKDEIDHRYKELFSNLKLHNNFNLFIWNIWSIIDFITIEKKDNLNFSKIEKNIITFFKSCNIRFDLNSNLINVLNPYLFFRDKNLFSSFLQKTYSLLRNRLAHGLNEFKKIEGISFKDSLYIVNEILVQVLNNSMNNSKYSNTYLQDFNKSTTNLVILEDDKKNYHYIRDTLFQKEKKGLNFLIKQKDEFGKYTIWKKLEYMNTQNNSIHD